MGGENGANLPQTRSLRERGFDVLLMTDQVDEFIPNTLRTYADHEFRNILTDDLELETEEEKKETEERAESMKACLDFIKETLGDKLTQVRLSANLGDHAVAMVPDGGMSFEMEKYFKAMDPNSTVQCGRILELNAEHAAVKALQEAVESDADKAEKYAKLFYYQGLMMAGLPIEDPVAYSDLVCEFMR